jgi:hypothetical protein
MIIEPPESKGCEMELGDMGSSNNQSHDLYRRRLAMSMGGIALSLTFLLVLMAIKGNFSFLWFIVTLLFVAGAVLSGMGLRRKQSWLTLAGASALIALVLAGATSASGGN